MANPTNLTSFIGIVQWLNTNTSNVFGYLLPFAIWGVLFMAMKNYDTARALLASSFLTSLFCLYWNSIGIINTYITAVFITFTVIGALWILLGGEK